MSAWIVHAVAFSQIVVLYWLSAAPLLRMVDGVFFARNPAWLADHPDRKAALASPRAWPLALYACGGAWLALMAHQGLQERREWQVFISLAPTFVWMFFVMAYAAVQQRRIGRAVPLATKRSAQLRRRALRDYLPPIWTNVCYGLYALELAVFTVAWLRGRIPLASMIAALAGIGGIVIIGSACLLYALRRKHQPADDAWGPLYRKVEVIGNVVTLYICQLAVLSAISNVFFGFQLFSALSFFVAVNVTLQAACLYLIHSQPGQRLLAAS
ncbi:MAG: hypothetical protein ABIT83_12725 [Massilia sp.]